MAEAASESADIKSSDLRSCLEWLGKGESVKDKHLTPLYSQRCEWSDKLVVELRERQFYESELDKLQHPKKKGGGAGAGASAAGAASLITVAGSDDESRDALEVFGELFGLTYTRPEYFARIYFMPHFRVVDKLVSLLTDSLLPNHYDKTQEHIMIAVMQSAMEHEFDLCEDMTTYLRENTCATKLLQAFLKRADVSEFIEKCVDQCGKIFCADPELDLEIDNEAILDSLIHSGAAAAVTDPNDPSILAMVSKRSAILASMIGKCMDLICRPSAYPTGLRIVYKALYDVANRATEKGYSAEEISSLAESLVGGFIFLRIFSPKLQLHGHAFAKKVPKHSRALRRRTTIIVKIIQNISNQVLGGTKELWMACMNDYITDEIARVKVFFKELVNVPPLQYFFDMDRQIRAKSPADDIVFISLADLKFLQKQLVEARQKRVDSKLLNDEDNSTPDGDSLETEFYRLVNDTKTKAPAIFEKGPGETAKFRYVKINVHESAMVLADSGLDSSDAASADKKFVLQCLPVLEQLGKNYLSEYDTSRSLLCGDTKSDLLTVLKGASKKPGAGKKLYGLAEAQAVIEESDSVTLEQNLLIVRKQTQNRVEMWDRLRGECADFKKISALVSKQCSDVRMQIKAKEAALEANRAKLKAEQTTPGQKFMKLFGGKKESKKDEMDEKMSGSVALASGMSKTDPARGGAKLHDTEVVGNTGMIGNLLVSLVANVSKEMGRKLAGDLSVISSSKSLKKASSTWAPQWYDFPESCSAYDSILSRMSRLGEEWMSELVRSIIDSDDERTTSLKSNAFRLTDLKSGTGGGKYESIPVVSEMFTFVMDFMMADMLLSCIRNIDPRILQKGASQDTVRKVKLDRALISKCLKKFTFVPSGVMQEDLTRVWSVKRMRKWGHVVSLLTPAFDAPMVADLVEAFHKCPDPRIKAQYMSCAKYIRLDSKRIEEAANLLQFLSDIVTQKGAASKSNLEVSLRAVNAVEHVTRLLDHNDINDRSVWSGQIFSLLSRLDAVKELSRSESIQSERVRLQSIAYIRGPPTSPFQDQVPSWLEKLSKFRFSAKKVSSRALADILHYLRGGGSTWDSATVHKVSSSDDTQRLEQAYGRITRQLHESAVKIFCDKIFRETRAYKSKDPTEAVIIHLLSACMIQCGLHSLNFIMKTVIRQFIEERTHQTVERTYVVVYALNFFFVPECRFSDYIKKMFNYLPADYRSVDEEMIKFKRYLSQVLGQLFVFLNKTMPVAKSLLSMADVHTSFPGFSVAMSSSTGVDTGAIDSVIWTDEDSANDQTEMFNVHVQRMLYFDWTREKLETYFPVFEDINLEFLIYCIRLAPFISVEDLWTATPANCGTGGKFVGRWLLHKDAKVRRQVMRTMVIAMGIPGKRDEVIMCFLEMIFHADYQSPAALTMLLKTLTNLMAVYQRKVMEADEVNKEGPVVEEEVEELSHTGSDTRGVSRSYIKSPRPAHEHLRDCVFLPHEMKWHARAEGASLVLLAHYDSSVRHAAFEFSQVLNQVFVAFFEDDSGRAERSRRDAAATVSGPPASPISGTTPGFFASFSAGRIRKTMSTRGAVASMSGARGRVATTSDFASSSGLGFQTERDRMHHCLGGVIELYGRNMCRVAMMQKNSDTASMVEAMSSSGGSSSISASSIAQSVGIGGGTSSGASSPSYAGSGVTTLKRLPSQQAVGSSTSKMLREARRTDLGFSQTIRMDGLIPTVLKQLGRKLADCRLHAVILSACDYLYPLLRRMVANGGKSGWSSSPNWAIGSNNQTHWINLHTLLFSMIGEGLASPFGRSAGSTTDHQKPGHRGDGGDTFLATRTSFQRYMISTFWEVLKEEAAWVTPSVVRVLSHAHWECIGIVLDSLIAHKDSKAKKLKRSILNDMTRILCRVTDVPNFSSGLYHSDTSLTKKMFTFVDELKEHVFRADRLEKSRWWQTQAELAQAYAHFLRALSKIGSTPNVREYFWTFQPVNEDEIWSEFRSKHTKPKTRDPMPYVNHSNEDNRFEMFLWLLSFHTTMDTANLATTIFEENESITDEQRGQIKLSIFRAIQYLLNMGAVIPESKLKKAAGSAGDTAAGLLRSTQNYVVNFLRGRKSEVAELNSARLKNMKVSVLELFVEAEMYQMQLLTPMLSYQFEYLLAFYIDQALENKHGKYFTAAIVSVLARDTADRLTVIDAHMSGQTEWRIGRPIGLGFLSLVYQYAPRLLFLGLMTMTSVEVKERYDGYLLCRSLAEFLVGPDLAFKVERYKYAFESSMTEWVRKNGLHISRVFARHCWSLAAPLFRIAIKKAEEVSSKEWIFMFLKPWAKVLHLHCLNKTRVDSSVVHFKQSGTESTTKGGSTTGSTATGLRSTTSRLTKSTAADDSSVADSVSLKSHESLTLLVNLFNITKLANPSELPAVLEIWQKLALGFKYSNLFAILDFLIDHVQENEPFGDFVKRTMPACKNVIFAIYEEPNNRPFVTYYIVRILLRVLTIGAASYSKGNLKTRTRAAEILTNYERIYQASVTSERNLSFKLDYGFEAHLTDRSDDDSKSDGGGMASVTSSPSSSDMSPGLGKLASSVARGRGMSSLLSQDDQAQITRARIAASLLIEIIGVSSEPVLPYFPVLVLYATLYFSSQSTQGTNFMRFLLIRLISTLAPHKRFQRLRSTMITGDEDSAGLAAALKASELELLWEDDASSSQGSRYSSSDRGRSSIMMDGGHFIAKYCDELAPDLESRTKIGYEALRWAMLATNLETSSKSFHIYTRLLSPLNQATVKVMLLTLAGALDAWDAASKYKASIGTRLNTPKEFNETVRDLDTLIRMASELKKKKELNKYVQLLWVGIAVMRCSVLEQLDSVLFDRGLELVCLFMDHKQMPELYVTAPLEADRITTEPDSHLVRLVTGMSSAVEERRLDGWMDSSRIHSPMDEDSALSEEFWEFCDEWTPAFEGIQPYLMQGLLHPMFEERCMLLLKEVLLCKMDALTDRTPMRAVLGITAAIPLIIQAIEERPEHTHVTIPQLLYACSKCVAPFDEDMSTHLSVYAKKTPPRRSNAQEFLQQTCRLLIPFFDGYARVISSYLDALIRSDGMAHYRATVFNMCRVFVADSPSYLFCFQPIIENAHSVVCTEIADQNTADAATELVYIAIQLANQEESDEVVIDVEGLPDFEVFPPSNLKQIGRCVWLVMDECKLTGDRKAGSKKADRLTLIQDEGSLSEEGFEPSSTMMSPSRDPPAPM